MSGDTAITIATPFFNEEESIPSYMDRIREVRERLTSRGWGVRHLWIDDGSRDATPGLLEARIPDFQDTRLVRHPRNLGYGAAIKTAMCLSGTPWLVFVDSDSNYDQRLILPMVEAITPETDVINVSILAPGGSAGYHRHRLLLSSVASGVYRLLLPRLTRGIYTLTCGFRLYRTEILPRLFPESDDYVATSESMLRALGAGIRVKEFPASNAVREHGVSKMKFLRVTMRHLALVCRTWSGMLGDPASMGAHLARIGSPVKEPPTR